MNIDTLSAKQDIKLIPWQWLLKRLMIAGMFILAIYLRSTLFSIRSGDYDFYLSPWYDFIQSHGGFAALKDKFANSNVPYLYLLTLATYVPLPKITIIKLISVLFDIVMALFVYLIATLKDEKSYLSITVASIVLFTPTVFINSAAWGQCDSIYASFSVGGLYFAFRKRPFWAVALFGLALSFKLQAVFLFPLLFVLLFTGDIYLRYFFIIPVIYLIAILPASLIGRDFIDLLSIYHSQTNQYSELTMNAPTIFQWIPASQIEPWKNAGIALTLSVVTILSFVVLTSQRKMTNEIILKLALLFVLIIPFLLPAMHERYFYLADVISIIYAFYFKKYFYIPILIQITSFLGYINFLLDTTVIDLKYLSFLVLGIITIVTLDLIKTLYPTDNITE